MHQALIIGTVFGGHVELQLTLSTPKMLHLWDMRSLDIIRNPTHFEQRKVQTIKLCIEGDGLQHLINRARARAQQPFVTSVFIGDDCAKQRYHLIGFIEGKGVCGGGGGVDCGEGVG